MSLAAPQWLLLWFPLALGVWLAERRLAGPTRRRRARTLARAALMGLALLALAAPYAPEPAPEPAAAVVVLDAHALEDPAARKDAGALIEQLLEAGPALELTAYGTGPGPVRTLPAGAGREAVARALADLLQATPAPAPAPAARGVVAGRLALGSRPGGVLLVSDGRGPVAGLAEAARAAAAAGAPVRADAVPRVGRPPEPRARWVGLDVPARVRGPFEVRGAYADRPPGAGAARLLVDGQERARVPVTGREGEVHFREVLLAPGPHEVALALLEGETPGALGRAVVHVEAPPRVGVLVVDAERSALRRALSVQGLGVEALAPEGLALRLADPRTLPEALVADAASLAALDTGAAEALAGRVREGLGLLVAAGADAGAWTALAATPLGALLPLEPMAEPEPPPAEAPPQPEPERPLDPPEPEAGPGLAAQRRPEDALPITLLLLVDRSPSMGEGGGMKLRMAVEGARRAAAALAPRDRVGVVTFADEATLDVPPTESALAASQVHSFLATVAPGGRGTNLVAALRLAGRVLEAETAPILHVILLTDGHQFPEGPLFSPVVRPLAGRGVTITGVGIGRQANLAQLRDIVQWAAGGLVVSAADATELPTILTRDTRRVADRRDEEARVLARLRDPQRPPEPRPDEPPAPSAPPARTPPAPSDPPLPPEPAPERLPLVRLRAHEATRQIEAVGLPEVGRPRAARPRPGAALLLGRADGRPVLAAARAGLGRVLLWALPEEDGGILAWPPFPALVAQMARSVLAPEGAFEFLPLVRVEQDQGEARLYAQWPPGSGAAALDVEVEVDGRAEALGRLAADAAEGLRLPDLGPGTLARLRLTTDDGRALAPLSYLVAPRAPAGRPAGDVDAWNAALAAPPGDAEEWLATLAPRPGERRAPLRWPLLAVALALFLVDAAVHRRGPGEVR